MKPKDCKTCKYAKLIEHPERHLSSPDYLEGRCRIPLFARITQKDKTEYCEDYERRKE